MTIGRRRYEYYNVSYELPRFLVGEGYTVVSDGEFQVNAAEGRLKKKLWKWQLTRRLDYGNC